MLRQDQQRPSGYDARGVVATAPSSEGKSKGDMEHCAQGYFRPLPGQQAVIPPQGHSGNMMLHKAPG
jgi:hypothetical protein